MSTDELLALSPAQVAEKILERRRLMQQILPEIHQRNREEADRLEPIVEKLRLERDNLNNKVRELKTERNQSNASAKELLAEVRELRTAVEASGGPKSLDPKWAQEKLEEQLDALEDRIAKEALSLNDERKLLRERKRLLEENEKWLEERRESNQEMAAYVDARKKMQKLFRKADKAHEAMLKQVEKSHKINDKYVEERDALRDATSQWNRADALIKQSEEAIAYWGRRVEEGFGDLGPGFPNLLADAERVKAGGPCTMKRRQRSPSKPRKPSTSGGEEE